MKKFLKLFICLALLLFINQESKAVVTFYTFTAENPSCPGDTGRAYRTSVTGTVGPYQFEWNNVLTPGTVLIGDTVQLLAGTYRVRVRDLGDNSLSFPQFFNITNPFQVTPVLIQDSVTCNGGNDGYAAALAFGGSPPFIFDWSNMQSDTSLITDPIHTDTIFNLTAGNYRLTLTDVNGCSDTLSIEVLEPDALQPQVTTIDPTCSGGTDGSATANPIGGSGNYTYAWSSSGNTAQTENGLAQGTYTVTVTDNQGCTGTQTFSITNPVGINVTLNPSDAFCFGQSNGAITSVVTGGTMPYTYLWNDLVTTTPDRTLIPAGTYTVTVTDNNGCTGSQSATVNQPSEIDVTFAVTDVLCNGDATGAITANATGGIGAKTYTWASGSGPTINTLTAGTYTVTVEDNFGCTVVDDTTVSEPPILQLVIDNQSDPSCNNGTDGSIDITATGGTPVLTYNWNDAPNTEDRTNLSAGTYTITVTDGNNCTASASVTLNNPAAIVPNVTPTDAQCNGASDGSATAAPSGGTTPYTYAWSSSGNTTNTETGLSANTYTVTITDNGGCSITETFTINQPTAIVVTLNPSDAFCFGQSNGSITSSVSGGTSPYTYLWDDLTTTTPDRTGIPAGTYTVTVTDNNGCTESQNATVNEPSEIDVTFTVTDVLCNGDATGSITANATGGIGAKTYTWASGSGATINSLTAGTYTVTVEDNFGCTVVDDTTIVEPTLLQLNLDSQTDPLCNGATDGTINITASGGVLAYTFDWNDLSSDEDRTGLGAGTYTVTLTDGNNCTTTLTTTLTDPAILTATIDSLEDATCGGLNDGFARVLAAGGTSPYTYAWSNSPTTAANPNLPAATYTVTVTDNNGCTATTSAVINAPVSVTASIPTSVDASCAGIDDGTATANGTGGVLPYTFNWGPGSLTGGTTNTVTGLAGGTYTVTVTDNNGCSDTESIVINQPPAVILSTDSIDVLCNGDSTGSAIISGIGGTMPYTYLWDTNAGSQTTDTASALPAGSYVVTVTDNNGCTNSATVTINEPTALTASITSSTDPTCNGIDDGTADVTASGGTSPYTYLWSDPSAQTTLSATGLGSGTFTVTVTDNNGCTDTAQVTLTAPPSVVINTDSISDINCNGGTDGFIRVAPSGGTPAYTYNWSAPGGTSPSLSGLSAGNYTVTVTDNNGCFSTESFTINEPVQLSIDSISVTDETCVGDNDGELTANVSGGTVALDYTYSWAPGGETTQTITNLSGGTYTVTVTDDNGCTDVSTATVDPALLIAITISVDSADCNSEANGDLFASATSGSEVFPNTAFNWSNGVIGQFNTNVRAGTYTVTVTNSNGCTETASATVEEPDTLKDNPTITDASCSGVSNGSISLSPSGGSAPYTYNWSAPGGTTSSLTGLAAGNYTVTLTDNKGCDSLITYVINNSSGISLNAVSDSTSCNGTCDGEVTLTPSGGTAPYTFSWSDGSTVNPATGLCAGLYSVTVTDANGCTADSSNIRIDEPDALTATINTVDESCAGANNGSAGASNTLGGVSPYTYTWSAGTPVGDTTTDLSAGTYTVTITDNNSCSITETFTINAGATIVINETVTDANCNGVCDGQIDLTPAGGLAPYTFTWDDGATTSLRDSLCAGNYDVTVTDNNGCSNTESYTINQPDTIAPNLIVTDESCFPGNDGTADASAASGGTPPYTYAWSSTISTLNNIGSLAAGNYTLTITDNNGCEKVTDFTVGSAGFFIVNSTVDSVTCNGGSDGEIRIRTLLALPPLTFNWNDGPTTRNRTNIPAGTYTVTITDRFGCTVEETADVEEPDTILANIVTTDESCTPGNDGTADVSAATGGIPPYTYAWSGSASTANNLTGLSNGSYDVTITDNKGCSIVEAYTIGGGSAVIVATINTVDESCSPGGDGSAGASNTSGGTAPYTYAWSGGTAVGDTTTGLTSGNYDVTITDNSGCTAIESFTINGGANIIPAEVIDSVSCFGTCDGEISLSPSGGVAPYTFNWNDGSTLNPNTNLCAGSYTVTITDNTGCSTVQTYAVEQPDTILLNASVDSTSCNGVCDGLITLAPSGGVSPFTFSWNDGVTTSDRTSLCAGTYSVTVEDSKGCTVSEAFIVDEAPALSATITTVDESCFGLADGSAGASSTSGGIAPYTYNWSGGSAVGDTTTGLGAGAYDVTITDSKGCSIVEAFSINAGGNVTTAVIIDSASCNGICDGSITLTPSGGVTPYTFLWDDATTLNPKTGLCAGTYTVTITDNAGCTIVETYTVNEPNLLVATINTEDEGCTPGGDGSAGASNTSGGTAPYTYAWSGGTAVGDTTTALAAGSYDVTITDNNGCSIIEAFTINSGSNIIPNEVIDSTTCNGICDGVITLAPSGGVAPYTFLWDDATTVNPKTGLCAGTYDVTITDNTACSRVETYTVEEPNLLSTTVNTEDESCSPGNDGSAGASNTIGGTAPYTFAWSGGTAAGDTTTAMTAGNYDVTITDNNGCSIIEAFTINGGANILPNDTIDSTSCNGVCDGAITLAPSGGVSPYTFLWDDATTVNPKTGLCAGTYDVTITDNTGCSTVQSLTVNEPNSLASTINTEDESCSPGSDGAAGASNTSGGTAPYTYSWSGGTAAGDTTTALVAGNYDVTITDNNGCSIVEAFTIIGGANILPNEVVDSASCNGVCDGEITLSPSGGSAPYTFNWNNGSTANPINTLCAGTYTVTITDLVGCSRVETYTIEEPDTLIAIVNTEDETCSPGGDGAAGASNVTGGIPPYTYAWSGGTVAGDTTTALAAGSYDVTITDNKGCSIVEAFTINSGSNIIPNEVIDSASCNGICDGVITLAPSGGVAPYTFLWDDATTINPKTGLCAGTYDVTITDNTGCTNVQSFTVEEPNILIATINTEDESCSPGNDGAAGASSTTGGTVPYTYAWSGGTPSGDTTTAMTAGNYDVTITDNNGCSIVEAFTINGGANILPNEIIDSASCNGICDGEITLAPSGGVAPYTFLWDDATTVNPKSNLCAGTYDVTITDNTGCTSIQSYTVGEPNTLAATVNTVDEGCFPGGDGSAGASNTTGGTAPYTYAWSGGTPAGDTTTALSSGSYDVTITDNNGCSIVEAFTINTGINIIPNEVIDSTTCNGICDGVITLSPTGGVAPYTFLWNDATAANPKTGLCAGTYTVTITDNVTCSRVETYTVEEPNILLATINTEAETCSPGNDGSAGASNTTGGTAPYTYAWSGGTPAGDTTTAMVAGNYDVTITDNNGCSIVEAFTINSGANITPNETIDSTSCNGICDGVITLAPSGGVSPYTFLWDDATTVNPKTGLCAGSYDVTITDITGCSTVQSYTVEEPNVLSATVNTEDEGCFPGGDGSAGASNTSGGTSPYTYAWSGGAAVGDTTTALAAGSYDVTITDNNGCSIVEAFTINTGSNIVPNEVIDSTSCNGICDGSITLAPSGGVSPYTFRWNDGTTANSLSGLCAGTYTVTITDNTTCSRVETYTVEEPNTLTATINTEGETCSPGNDGSAGASNTSGGTAPYTYAWSGGTPAGDTTTAMVAGNYDVTITDNNGCSIVEAFTINSGANITPNETIDSTSCNGICDGSITLAPTGGVAPYTYLWNDATTTNPKTGLCAGNYDVTITDITGCSTVQSYTVEEPNVLAATVSTEDEGCSPGGDGSAGAANTTGGTAPYTYAWSAGSPAGDTTTGLVAGNYDVTITDNNGCSIVEAFIIGGGPQNIFPNEIVSDESCSGICDGRIELVPTGGSGPYTYTWNPTPPNGAGVDIATNLCSGNYQVTITDAIGCDTNITLTILPASPIITNITTEDMSCSNTSPCDGRVYATPSGGIAPYTYNWGSGDLSGPGADTVNAICVGNYSVTITDANSCSVVENYSISSPTAIGVSFALTNATCNIANGKIVATASGGDGNYTYQWFDATLNPVGTDTNVLENLSAGAFSLRITDNTGCTDIFNTSISDIGAEVITLNKTDIDCHGAANGSATVSFNCSDPNCSISWVDASTGTPLGVSTNTINGLDVGNYYVEVTNNSGCIAIENFSITQPSPFVVQSTVNDATCNLSCDGSISVNVSGGTGTYTYSWSPAPATGQGTNTISGLCAANYRLRLLDGNGCDTIIQFTVEAPDLITASFTIVDASCGGSDGFINSTVTGGTVAIDYQYQWFDATNTLLVGETNPSLANVTAGSYRLRITDDNACEQSYTAVVGNIVGPVITVDSVVNNNCANASNGEIYITATDANTPLTYSWSPLGQTTEDIFNLSEGTYTVQVTNSIGCVTVETIDITSPTELDAVLSTTDAECGLCNGEASVTVSGGLAPYTYLWNNGSTVDSTTGLCGGINNLEITDANGCIKTIDFSINTNGGPSSEVVTATPTSCANSCDGSVRVIPAGGTTPYTYLWQHNGATTNNLSGLCQGSYSLLVSDAKGCSRTVQVDITGPRALVIQEQIISNTCGSTLCSGSIQLNVTGGSAPYSYSWSSPSLTDTNYVDQLCEGIYSVTVTDGIGCTSSELFTISNQGNPIQARPSKVDVSCHNVCDGSLISNITPSVGVSFQWLDNAGTAIAGLNNDVIGSVCPGEYVLEVTSIPNNCKSYFNLSINERDSIILGVSVNKPISCTSESDGQLFVSAAGGDILYTYAWSDPNSQTTNPAIDLSVGTYTVTVTDEQGCSETSSIILFQPSRLNADILSNTDLICSSDCNATATSTASGGTAPYTYEWSGGQVGENPIDLCFGQNILTVIDANGCSAMDTVMIGATDTVAVNILSSPIVCDGDSIRLLGSTLGNSINSVAWYLDDTSTVFTTSLDTTFIRPVGEYRYFLIATNSSCSDTAEFDGRVVPNPPISVLPTISIFRDEVATLRVTGADPSYDYLWSPSTDLNDSSLAEPISSTRETINYILTVTDSNGCQTVDSTLVDYSVLQKIATGISPNGDGVNDVWELPLLDEFPNATVQIFNRWGTLVYEQRNGYNKPWDGKYEGKFVPIGTYYYVIDLKTDRLAPLTGPITVVK